jgi:hypothetical protein
MIFFPLAKVFFREKGALALNLDPANCGYQLNSTSRSDSLKGTVARDFLPLDFSPNRPHIVPEFTPRNVFEFFFKYAKIFVFECCSAGFDTPQDFVPRGLIPRRTLFSGVSDPAGHCSAGYQTHRTSVCFKMYTTLPLFCRV